MMRGFISIALFLISFLASAQFNSDVGITLGSSNYLGEMGGKEKTGRPWLLDMKLSQTRWAMGGFYRYRIMENLFVRADFIYFRIQGADSLSTNPPRVARNLHFRNDIFELTARAEYVFYSVHDVGHTGRYLLNFNTYVFLGAGGFLNNPKAKYQDKFVSLRPLETEGKKYSKFQFSMPIGAGFYYTYKRQHRVGFEIGWRFTLTDYIDDVSKTYPYDTTGMSPDAIALSDRSQGKAGTDGFPQTGNYGPTFNPDHENPRGNPKRQDNYLLATLHYSYVIKGAYKNKRFRTSSRRSSLGGYKRRKRKTRAKF
ncbi:MAG: hypothetical protein COA57_10330 [Flavobacteriales bacterium]|nr:MAG: hypothetical protein COA57_10330 [Flavobacteriales bacterium]